MEKLNIDQNICEMESGPKKDQEKLNTDRKGLDNLKLNTDQKGLDKISNMQQKVLEKLIYMDQESSEKY